MKFGAHVSISPSIADAPRYAYQIGSEVFQIFSRPPRGGPAPRLSEQIVAKFQKECSYYKLSEFYIHTPYFINLASGKDKVYFGSITVLKEDLKRCNLLGAKYLVSHLGSAKDFGKEEALKKVVTGLGQLLRNYRGKTQLLIEIAAGAGQIIGDRFEEIAYILNNLSDLKFSAAPAVCFDTAHAFQSGYDLRTTKVVKKTLNEFDKIIGLSQLKLIHVNDSKTTLGSRVDRHEHIGEGQIGVEGFQALVQDPRLKHINMIIETPPGRENDIENLKLLRKLSKI